MSKIAVVGGAGYVGSFTALALSAAGEDVLVIDDFSSGHKASIEKIPFVDADILRDDLAEIFEREEVLRVIHFAALIQVGESMEKPGLYFKHNVFGSLNVLEACVKARVSSFVFSSTAGVYGAPVQIPIPETNPLSPNSVYGETKVMVEKMMRWYWEVHKLPSLAIRYFNAAGAELDGSHGEDHENESHLIPRVIQSVLGDSQVTIFGDDYDTPDGTCIRDYVHVLDLADVHIKALEYLEKNQGNFVFNAGSGQGYSNMEVIKMVEKVSGKKVGYRVGERRFGDVDKLVADPRLAKSELSWEVKNSSLETIVSSAWKWHSGHPSGYGD